MTLVAAKKPPSHHKKTSGNHHRKTKDYHKPYWPYLPILAVLLLGVVVNAVWPARPHDGVLAYATDMSVQSLLDDTNAQRTGNGLGSLGLNAQLDQAAQAKANDMVARDYWSHNTPDGQAPWTFITAAGYNYQTAGENLAYGFATAADTLTGWMNSPGHRANILNTTYQEVGFGIANSPNYQGTGPETVVVAEYAQPAGSPVATATPGTTPTPAVKTAPVTTSSGTTAAQSQAGGSAADQPTPAVATTTPSAASQTNGKFGVTAVVEPKAQSVKEVQLITAGNAAWSGFAVAVVVAAALALFLLRHAVAWHKVIRKGERFIIKHPWLDAVAVAIVVAGLLLSRVSGVIK